MKRIAVMALPPRPEVSFRRGSRIGSVAIGLSLMLEFSGRAQDSQPKALEVARLSRAAPVDFQREILPFFQASCLPCHNKTTTKAELLLETPADMLKGGESGPALVPGKAAESLVFKLAAHREKPRMPPKENKVNAVNLTPEELGLLELWINQGARASEHQEEVIRWQALAAGVQAIHAVSLTSDGQYAACGRGNRLAVYHLPTARLAGDLVDPGLATNGTSAAHQDFVESLAFSPDGRWLASGGFREIKLWERRPLSVRTTNVTTITAVPTNGVWRSPDGLRQVERGTNGFAQLKDGAGGSVAELKGDPRAVLTAAGSRRAANRARSMAEFQKSRVEATAKEWQAQQDRLKKAEEARRAAEAIRAEKTAVETKARRELLLAEVQKEVAVRAAAGVTNAPGLAKAEERLTSARAAVDKAEGELRPAALKASTAENEHALAMEGVMRADSARNRAAWLARESGEKRVAAEDVLRSSETNRTSAERPVRLAAFSPDNRWVASADEAGLVVIWAATNGLPAETWRAPAPVRSLEFATPDTLVVGTEQGGFALDFSPRWELAATLGSEGKTSRLADRVNALAFSPDGRWLVSGGGEPSRSGEIWFWDPATRRAVFGLTNLHSDTVLALAFSPDGRWLASGGADRFARVVEVASGRQVRALEGHTGHVLGVGWRADGQMLASAGADLLVKFWDAATGERRKQATGFGREVTALAHLAGSDQWVAASGDAELRVINENGERVRGLTGAGDFTQALAVSADGQWVVAGGQEGVLRIWAAGQEPPRWAFAPETLTDSTVAK